MTYLPPFNGGRLNASISGNTAGVASLISSGTMVLAGGNNITLSQNNGTITIAGGGAAAGGIALGNSQTTYTSGTANLNVAGGALTIASTTGQGFNFSAPATSSLSATGAFSISTVGSTINMGVAAFSAGMSSDGNTSGVTGFATSRLVIAGGNNITLSQATGAAGNTLTISAPNQSNQNLSLYALGNSTQNSSTLMNASNLSFNGLGGVSIGYSNGSIQISGATGGGGAGGTGSGIALANSQTTYSSGIVNLVEAGGAITVGSSINGAAQLLNLSVPQTSSLSATGAVSIFSTAGTISIGAMPAGTISNWEPLPVQYGSLSNTQLGNASLYFYKLQPHAYVSASQFMELISMSLSTSSNVSYAGGVSLAAGIYSATGSSLSLVTQSSGSTNYQWNITSNSNTSLFNGLRGMTIPLNVNMSEGNYWIGLWSSSSSQGSNWASMSNVVFTNTNAAQVYQGIVGQAGNSTQGIQENVGMYNSTVAALPNGVSMSRIIQYSLRNNIAPYMAFKNQTW